VHKALNTSAKNGEFLKVTKAINGGTIGLKDRESYYEKAKLALQ